MSTQVKSAEHNASLLTIISLWFPIGLGVIGPILIGLSVVGCVATPGRGPACQVRVTRLPEPDRNLTRQVRATFQ